MEGLSDLAAAGAHRCVGGLAASGVGKRDHRAHHQRRMNNLPKHPPILSRRGQHWVRSRSIRAPLAIKNC